MSDTHIWNVNIGGAETIGEIIESESTFNTGPYDPGAQPIIAVIKVKNIGNQTGNIYSQAFINPGTPDEQPAENWVNYLAPGETGDAYLGMVIPVDIPPGSILPVGVKTWGATETEPSWITGQIYVASVSSIAIPILALGGLLALSYFSIKKK